MVAAMFSGLLYLCEVSVLSVPGFGSVILAPVLTVLCYGCRRSIVTCLPSLCRMLPAALWRLLL